MNFPIPQTMKNNMFGGDLRYNLRKSLQAVTGLLGLMLASAALAISLAGEEPEEEEKVFELSPFVVQEGSDIGYAATSTLGGTRFETNLFETPAAISVMTKELMDDLNVENLEEYVVHAPSTERDIGADPTGLSAQWTGARVKIRGFSGVPVTRDYFNHIGISQDRFNVERLDFQKGPNAVLYGIGGPGGVINYSTKRALLGSEKSQIDVTVGSDRKRRYEADFNIPVIKDKLAIRLNGLWEDGEFWQKPSSKEERGIALAATWRPLSKTEIRVNFERMESKWNNGNFFPSSDNSAAKWYLAGAPLVGDPLRPQDNPDPSLFQGASVFQVFYMPQVRDQPFRTDTQGVDMRPDLDGNQATGWWRTVPGPNAYPTGGYSDLDMLRLLGEETNFFGPGNTRDQDYSVGSIIVTQQLAGFDLELAYSRLERFSITFSPLNWQAGVFGDPNPVLPGLYYADGDIDPRFGAFPGTLLPDVGAANPFAGQLYVEDTPTGRDFDNWSDNYRVTISRKFDFTDRSQWLGRHTFAALWQLDDGIAVTAPLGLYNATPNNNDAPDHFSNLIRYRTYLDLGPGGIKWALDPAKNIVPGDTGVTPQYFHNQEWDYRLTKLEGRMAVLQSSFLKDRIITTAGIRRDRQTLDRATEGEVLVEGSTRLRLAPNSIFTPETSPWRDVFEGTTFTLGVFVSPLPWLAFTYNKSDSVQPQGERDMFGDPIGNREGNGEDYGVRLQLLDKKLYITATYYEASDDNQILTGGPSVMFLEFNSAWKLAFDTSTELGIPLPSELEEKEIGEFEERWDRWDYLGDGYELEIVGNLTPAWRVSLNYSRNNARSGSVFAPDHLGFLEDYRSVYEGNPTPLSQIPNDQFRNFIIERDNTPDRNFTTEPATFNDVYEYTTQVVENVRVGAQKQPFEHADEQLNLFTSYQFRGDVPVLLKNTTIGVGANYRSAPVIGYDAANGNREIFGDSYIVWRLFLSRRFPLKAGRFVQFQLNVSNVFAQEDLLPFGTSSPDRVERYRFQRERRAWTLRMTYSF